MTPGGVRHRDGPQLNRGMPRDPQIDGHDSVLPQPIRTLRLSSAHTLKAKGEGPSF